MRHLLHVQLTKSPSGGKAESWGDNQQTFFWRCGTRFQQKIDNRVTVSESDYTGPAHRQNNIGIIRSKAGQSNPLLLGLRKVTPANACSRSPNRPAATFFGRGFLLSSGRSFPESENVFQRVSSGN